MNPVRLTLIRDEPRVDSRVLAEQLGVKPKNTLGLIERYLSKFERFGVVPFQTEKPGAGTVGGRPERFVLLNEDQCYFLLSLSRNSDVVVELKADLITAFCEARYGHAYQTLEAARKEASQSGRRLARWRYQKPRMQQHVAHLREQLKLPLELKGVSP
ncbi:Rha family transcriptional regulator [Pseudomonas sp. FSL R10-1339]|uniref:Rha family transcriptional regulator n=1 Tax=Pseudomonas sp. FSL R10-1339 TaxID=2662196 RepID=UPI001296D4C7|nr:Rha family transcriptional regulator [Pseudomonas sp. FSL R10-1339]MQU52157.1 hypothetical protein [Pseudomonas sp. FSL R10-1339]